MEVANLLPILQQASLYDLFCLRDIINTELDNYQKIEQIKAQVTTGKLIEYFEVTTNRLIKAIVIKKYKKNVLVENLEDHTQWLVKYFMLNLNEEPLTQTYPTDNLKRHNLSVVDIVGFEHKGNKITGKITKLSLRMVNLITTLNQKWNVYYENLFQVIDVTNIIDTLSAKSEVMP